MIKLPYKTNKQKHLQSFQNEYKGDIGAEKLIHDKKEHVLMARWRYPSLSIHGKILTSFYITLCFLSLIH